MNWDILEKDLPNPTDGWVTVDEASKLVEFSVTSVMYWAEQGYINAYHVGQRTRIVNLEQVQAFAQLRRRARGYDKFGKNRIISDDNDDTNVAKSQ